MNHPRFNGNQRCIALPRDFLKREVELSSIAFRIELLWPDRAQYSSQQLSYSSHSIMTLPLCTIGRHSASEPFKRPRT